MKSVFMCVNYPQYNMAIGISKKINMQIETFKKLGFDVYYSQYLENGVAICHDGKVIESRVYNNIRLNNVLRRFRLLSFCKSFIENKHFTLGFIRWDPIDSLFLQVLDNLDKSCDKVLIDFHGYFPGYAGKGIKGKYTQITTKMNGDKLAKYVDFGLVELKADNVFGVKTLPTDTSIDVNKYQPHSYSGSKSELHIISVSNETIYHGYDRLIMGIAAYNKKNIKGRIVRLHLVGKMTDKTVKLINQLGVNDSVILYGYKSGDELNAIYDSCNIAAGPLAPHRIGGKQGTGIKTKEYFAIGIPYFYAGNELLVPKDYKYTLCVEDNESPIDINKIFDFYDSISEDNEMSENMRDFAREKFSCFKTFKTALIELGFA